MKKLLCIIGLHSWIEYPRRIGLQLHPELEYCDWCNLHRAHGPSPWFLKSTYKPDETEIKRLRRSYGLEAKK